MKPVVPPHKKTAKLRIREQLNFHLAGISSHENDYRLVWAVNNQLSTDYARIDNLILRKSEPDPNLEFSRYMWSDEDRMLTYYLISNRCPDGFLFPDLRKFDYFLQVSGECDDKTFDQILKDYRKTEIISAIYRINPENIRGDLSILEI